MENCLKCPLCKHFACAACALEHRAPGWWLHCCRCGFGALARFWSPEHRAHSCQFCGHERCETCLPDTWPRLADGCCKCRARIVNRARGGRVA
jgi:hypothetical protein